MRRRLHPRAALGRPRVRRDVLVAGLCGILWALAGPAASTPPATAGPPAASGAPPGWSDPITIASTSTAVPPVLSAAGGRLHLFWVDRPRPGAGAGDLWLAVLSPEGRQVLTPRRIRRGLETRLAFPAAAAWGERIAVAWMVQVQGGVILEVGVLDGDGSLHAILRPDPVPREAGGRIALAASPGGGPLYVAWSRFDRDQREVWYARVEASGVATPDGNRPRFAAATPVPAAPGDAPALLLDPSPLLFWWEAEGAGTFRLVMGEMGPRGLTSRRALTGALALVAPLPVLPSLVATDRVVLVPTIERAFATGGSLYALRLGSGAATGSSRIPLLGRARVAGFSTTRTDGGTLAVWSQPAGRRQNSEVFAAVLSAGEDVLPAPARVTFTSAGSLRPAAAVVDGRPVVAWLEVAGVDRFSVAFATSTMPRRRLFLLGIPELDLFRPGPALLFALLAILSTLPIALLISGIALSGGILLIAVVHLLAAPFGRLDEALRRPTARTGATLAAVAAVQVAARGMIPGQPDPPAVAGPLLLLGIPVVWWVSRREPTPMARLIMVFAAVLAAALAVLFPWGTAQLSQF